MNKLDVHVAKPSTVWLNFTQGDLIVAVPTMWRFDCNQAVCSVTLQSTLVKQQLFSGAYLRFSLSGGFQVELWMLYQN